jgi:hypothetical protein
MVTRPQIGVVESVSVDELATRGKSWKAGGERWAALQD